MHIVASKYCRVCGRVTAHARQPISHVLHLLLTLLTAGLWLPIWLLFGLTNSVSAARCTQCGSKQGGVAGGIGGLVFLGVVAVGVVVGMIAALEWSRTHPSDGQPQQPTESRGR